MIYKKPKLNIIATILAKNEEDIIATTIEHHLKNGVSKIILTDNNSSDSTKTIASKYPEVVEIIDELGDDHRQSEWVTRMAVLACKFNPDWIIHLDADELWCGLSKLQNIHVKYLKCSRMYLHPPTNNPFNITANRFYIDLDHLALPQECKVAHRPDPNIIISHGNHDFISNASVETKEIWRHHYPVRSFDQFRKKAVNGHKSLSKRNTICERWKLWNDLDVNCKLEESYNSICCAWEQLIHRYDSDLFVNLLKFWSTNDVIDLFLNKKIIPRIGEWPKQNILK